MSTPTEQHQEHLHEVHERLRHESTAHSPEEIRQRLRRAELALQRQDKDGSPSSGKPVDDKTA
jgi:hypothetical protein